MNQRKRLRVQDVYKTTIGKVSASVLLRFPQIFSKSAKGKRCQTEGVCPVPITEHRDKSVMTLKADKDIITEISVSDFLFLGCLF